jgi:YHS domain-containing protein
MNRLAYRAALAILASLALQRSACAQPAESEREPRRPPAAQAPAIPLAAEGFCVVTLHDQRAWQQGDPRVAVVFDGRIYRFATGRELEIFAAAPTVYAPVLGGDCLTTFAETGQRVPGKIQLGVVQGGRLHFFADADARSKFLADPARYADADVADDGRCLVTRVDRQREVQGLPETAVLSGGLRRLFAGAYEQSLYLQNPARYDAESSSPTPGQAVAVGQVAQLPPEVAAAVAPAADATARRKAASTASESGGDEADLSNEPMIGGYCPVAIRQRGVWVRGRYEDRVELNGLVFYTAGKKEQAAFQANPAQFMPVLGGECPVSLLDLGQKVRGSIYHAAEFEGRLFLFSSAENKAAFKQAAARYASVDVAAHGECVVTLAETGRHLPGFPQYIVWHEGLLYRFAGEEEQAKFLAAPEKYAVEKSEQ